MGSQEELYTPMAEALSIRLLSPCFGFRQGPIQNNYMDQASSINECSIFASILFRLLGTIGIYERRQFDAHRLRSSMLHSCSSYYWYVGNEHSISWKTMPLYLNVTHILPIVLCRCFLGDYVHYGIAGAL